MPLRSHRSRRDRLPWGCELRQGVSEAAGAPTRLPRNKIVPVHARIKMCIAAAMVVVTVTVPNAAMYFALATTYLLLMLVTTE